MVDQASRFVNPPQIWLFLAITTPWPNGDIPPNENDTVDNPQFIEMTSIVQPIAFKKLDEVQLVVPSASGALSVGNQNYIQVTLDTAVAQGARWVNFRSSLNYAETNSKGNVIIGDVTYRQYGLVSGLVPNPGFTNESVLLPNQVQSTGNILMVANITPHTHSIAIREVINLIREIRG